MFFCEFYEIFKNTFFTEYIETIALQIWKIHLKLHTLWLSLLFYLYLNYVKVVHYLELEQ